VVTPAHGVRSTRRRALPTLICQSLSSIQTSLVVFPVLNEPTVWAWIAGGSEHSTTLLHLFGTLGSLTAVVSTLLAVFEQPRNTKTNALLSAVLHTWSRDCLSPHFGPLSNGKTTREDWMEDSHWLTKLGNARLLFDRTSNASVTTSSLNTEICCRTARLWWQH